MQFYGEVAWVTGSSKGIGRAVSVGLAERGCDVVHSPPFVPPPTATSLFASPPASSTAR